MNLSLRSLLVLVAALLFLLAAFGVNLGTVSIVSLGLALFAASFAVSDSGIGLKS